MHLEGGKLISLGPLSLAPRVSSSGSGSLFGTVQQLLLEERKAQALRKAAGEVTPMAVEPAVVLEPKPASTFGSRFDRFGGANRQSMYSR